MGMGAHKRDSGRGGGWHLSREQVMAGRNIGRIILGQGSSTKTQRVGERQAETQGDRHMDTKDRLPSAV